MMQMSDSLYEAVVPKAPPKPGELEEYRIAQKNWERYLRARDNGHLDYIKIADKSEAFYVGEQWDQSDMDELKRQGRPALTINKILSTVNTILGEQITRRADIQYKPRKDGTEEVAHTLTKLAMAIADANRYDWVESEMVSNGVIRERGYLDIRMDFDESPEGEVKITCDNSSEVIPDPDARSYDPRTWNEVFSTRWMSLDDIAEQYGQEKADAVQFHGLNGDTYGSDSFRIAVTTFGGQQGAYNPYEIGVDGVQKDIKAVRVIERQYYQRKKCYYLTNPIDGTRKKLPDSTTAAEAKQLAQAFRSEYFTKNERKIRWTVSCDQILLHDDWSPYRTFTKIPFFCYFRPGKPFGPIRNLISPQEMLNKLSSQELHIVNTTANSGWIIERGSLHGMDADDVRKQGSTTGVVLEVNPGKKAPEKIKPNTIPTGIERISTKAAINIKEISGVTDALLGLESAEVSGVALDSKENRGQVQLQVILDNLARTRHMVGEKLLELIQDFYTEERVVYVAGSEEPNAPREPITINQQQDDGTIANQVTEGQYDVIITTMPSRDSFNDTQFAEAINMRKIGVNVPDHWIAQYSHLAKKGELVDTLKQLQGLSPPSPEEQQLAQMQQQLHMMGQQLELEKVRAEIMELQAEAAFKMAKAKDTSENSEKFLHELESKLQLKREEFELRRRLSALSAVSKLDAIQLQGRENTNTTLLSKLTDAKLQETQDERDRKTL